MQGVRFRGPAPVISIAYSNMVKGRNNRKYIISCKYSQVLAVSTRALKIQTWTRTSIFPRVTWTRESGYSRVFPRVYSHPRNTWNRGQPYEELTKSFRNLIFSYFLGQN